MEPTILKTPRIYNGAGIYKTGAEGGGGGAKCVEIGGDVYKVITIGNKEFITENLRYWGNGINYDWPPYNGRALGRPYYQVSSYNQVIYVEKFGIYYNIDAKNWISQNLDLKGFRILGEEDLSYIKDLVGITSIKSKELWTTSGSNESEFNLYPNGWVNGNSYDDIEQIARLWNYDNTQQVVQFNNEGTISTTWVGDLKMAGIRLCRDA